LNIPSGQLYSDFQFDFLPGFDTHKVFDIRAQLGSDTAAAYGWKKISDSGFTEQLSSSSVTTYGGEDTTPVTVSLTSIGSYTSIANLSCQRLLTYYEGNCEFTPSQVSIPTGGSATAKMVIHSKNIQFTSRDIVVVASDGVYSRYAPFTFEIVDLVLFIHGSAASTSPGIAIEPVTLSGISPINVSCTGLPSGASCDFTNAAKGSFAVSVPPGIAPGTYNFTVTATSSSKSVSANTTLIVNPPPDLTIDSPSASNSWAPVGGTATRIVTVRGVNGFSGSVHISCTTSWNGSCTGNDISLAPNGDQNVSLSIAVPTGTALGKYTLGVTVTGANITRTLSEDFMISDVSGTLSPSTIGLVGSIAGSTSLTLTPSSGFNGQIQLACSAPVGLSCLVSPNLVTLTTTPQSARISLSATSTVSSDRQSSWLSAMILAMPFLGVIAPYGKKQIKLGAALFLIAVLSNCGGGGRGSSNGGSGGPPTSGSTTNYTVSVGGSIVGTTVSKTFGAITVSVQH
jgi:hypothetical protein